jgi:glycosyltransferase involved in cell wall biosynthesis
MKIVLFHQEFYYSGGAELTLFETIDFLQSQGHTVECYAPLISVKTCFPDIINKYPIKAFLPYIQGIPREITILTAALLAPILVLKIKNADIFYGANQSGPFFAYIASLVHRKPFLIYSPYPLGILYPRKIDSDLKQNSDLSWIGKTLLSLIKPLLKPLDRKIVTSASAVITEGSNSQKLFELIYNREIINCPAGSKTISKDEFTESKKFGGQITINNKTINKPFILLTNRHMPKKRFEYAIELAQKLSTTVHKNVQFVITGKCNEYTETLLQKINYLKLKTIIFTDYTSDLDTDVLYKNAAVYLYTAPEEDYGKGIVQALGSGTPAIAWNNAGPTSIIKNNVTGFLISPFNMEEMSEKAQSLLSDQNKSKQIGLAALEDVTKNLSSDVHNKIVLNTIESIQKATNSI